jgi:dihydrofolate reductase
MRDEVTNPEAAMRQLVASLYASIDGFAGDTDDSMWWVTDGFGPEQAEFGVEHAQGLDAMILGRVTYEIMASYWPSAPADDPFAAVMNEIPKLVFSSTLDEASISWSNTRLVRGDAVDQVDTLKEAAGGVIGIAGSISLLHALMEASLVDKVSLQVQPIVLGTHGKNPIFGGVRQTAMQLVGTTVLDARVVALEYQADT